MFVSISAKISSLCSEIYCKAELSLSCMEARICKSLFGESFDEANTVVGTEQMKIRERSNGNNFFI